MKIKLIALVLAVLMLLPLLGCNTQPSEVDPPITTPADGSVSDTSTETTPADTSGDTTPLPPADIVLNAEGATYKLIRPEVVADEIVGQAAALRIKLCQLIGNLTAFSISEDWLGRDESADNDNYELLIGLTNRPESAAAAEALPGYKDFSISVIDNKICIYANTAERMGQAIDHFLSALTVTDGKIIYSGGNYVDKYVYPLANMTICDTHVKEYSIVTPAAATSAEKLLAEALAEYIRENVGVELNMVDDTAPAGQYEILIGATNRAESANAAKEGYKITTENKKLCISAVSSAHYNVAKRDLFAALETSDKLEAGLNIAAVDSALDLFLKDNYAADIATDDVNLGVLAMLSSLEYFNDRMVYGSTQLGEKWIYSNSGKYAAQTGHFDTMLKSEKKGGNCASPVNWALCEMGIVPTNDRFYGGSTGNFKSYSGNARTYLAPYVEVFDYYKNPVPFHQLYKEGKVKTGDIFLCKHHTFVYRGNESFYAAGHDGAWHTDPTVVSDDDRQAVFDNWVLGFDQVAGSGEKVAGKYNTNYNYDVYYIVRLRDDYVPAKYRNAQGELVANPMVENQ